MRQPYGGYEQPGWQQWQQQQQQQQPGAGQFGWSNYSGPEFAYGGGGAQRVHVDVPADPSGVLAHSHAAHELLAHDALVVVR